MFPQNGLIIITFAADGKAFDKAGPFRGAL